MGQAALSGEALDSFWNLEAPKHLIADPQIGPIAKLTWMVLADMGRNHTQVFFEVRTIAEKIGASERATRDGLRELEDCGWLGTEQRPGLTSLYFPKVLTPAESAAHPGVFCRPTPAESADKTLHLRLTQGEKRPPKIGAEKQELHMLKGEVFGIFRRVLGQKGWQPSWVDSQSVETHMEMLRGYGSANLSRLFTSKLSRVLGKTHLLADTLQLIANEGESEPKANGAPPRRLTAADRPFDFDHDGSTCKP